jgi:hypothetical protein
MMTARNTHLGYMHDGDRDPADEVPQEVLPAAVPRQPFQHRDRIQDARKRSYLFNLLTTLLCKRGVRSLIFSVSVQILQLIDRPPHVQPVGSVAVLDDAASKHPVHQSSEKPGPYLPY